MATIVPQIYDMNGWMRKNNRAARAERFLMQFFDVLDETTTWNFIFEILTTMRAHNRKSSILCLYMKSIFANQVKGHLAHLVQGGQSKTLMYRKILFWSDLCGRHCRLLNSHMTGNTADNLTCPWPSEIVWILFPPNPLSLANLSNPAMGSAPGDRTKINGAQQWESL